MLLVIYTLFNMLYITPPKGKNTFDNVKRDVCCCVNRIPMTQLFYKSFMTVTVVVRVIITANDVKGRKFIYQCDST